MNPVIQLCFDYYGATLAALALVCISILIFTEIVGCKIVELVREFTRNRDEIAPPPQPPATPDEDLAEPRREESK